MAEGGFAFKARVCCRQPSALRSSTGESRRVMLDRSTQSRNYTCERGERNKGEVSQELPKRGDTPMIVPDRAELVG